MCLISKTYILTVATEDIPVYKVLVRNKYGVLLTPYREIQIPKVPYVQEAEGPQTVRGRVSENRRLYPFFSGDYYEVTEGFIHAYTNKEAAMVEIASWHIPCVIVKGYIPKGVPYFVGVNDDTICATRINLECIVLEELKWRGNRSETEEIVGFSWHYCKSYKGTLKIYFSRFKIMLKQLFCKHIRKE